MAEGFLLGCHHGTTFAQIDRACELLKEFEKKHGTQAGEDISAPAAKKAKK